MLLHNHGLSLRIRQTHPDDTPILLNAYADEAFIRLFRSNHLTQSEEQLRKALRQRLEHPPEKIGYLEFMIEHVRHGAIGIAALGDYSAVHRRAEFLIGLFDARRRYTVYGGEATLLVLDLAFNAYNLHKVYTYVYDYNKASENATVGLGFKQEGCLEGHHFLLKEKRFVDLYINGLTQACFRNGEKIRKLSLRLVGRDITLPYSKVNLLNIQQHPLDRAGRQRLLEGMRQAQLQRIQQAPENGECQ